MKKRISNKLLAIVLVLGVLISIGSFVSAKYITEKNISNSAQVAKFDVQLTGDSTQEAPNKLEIDGIEDKPTVSYVFTVTSNSEVSVSADLTVELDDALPDGVVIKLEDTTDTTNDPVEKTNPDPVSGDEVEGKVKTTYTYTEVATFEAGTQTSKSFKLSFIGGDHGSITESKDIAVAITVTASQSQ